MPQFENALPTAFVVVAGLWLGLSAFVLISRILYDRSWRAVDAVSTILGPELLSGPPTGDRRRRLAAILDSLSRRTIERVAADASTPEWIAEAFAVRAVAGGGEERLLRWASSHRSELGRWRRAAALRILARARHKDAMRLLRRAVTDGDRELAGAVVTILGAIPDFRAAYLLVDALREERYAPSRIATHLDRFPLAIGHLLRPLLADDKPHVRFWAASLLGRYGRERGVGIELAGLADDPDPNVRAEAAESLGRARRSKARDAAVRRLLEDPVWYVRTHAARAAGELGLSANAELVTRLLADEKWWVRAAAKHALVCFGDEARDVLLGQLDHPDRFARNGAAEVLQNNGVVEELLAELGGDGATGRSAALLARILRAGGPELEEAVLAEASPEARRRLERARDAPTPAMEAA